MRWAYSSPDACCRASAPAGWCRWSSWPSAWCSPDRLSARLFGALSGVWGAATLVGPLIGGAFATLGLWRWVFWAFGAQALVFIVGVATLLKPDAPGEQPRLPPPLSQLGLIALGVLIIAIAGLTRGWWALIGIVAGMGLLVAAFAIDRGARSRILPRGGADLSGVASLGYAAIFFFSAGTAIHTIYTPVLVQRIDRVSPLVAGYVVACEALGWSAVSMVFGGADLRLQNRLISLGGILVTAGLIGLALVVGHGSIWWVAGAATVMGAGMGASFPFISTRVMTGLDGDERGAGLRRRAHVAIHRRSSRRGACRGNGQRAGPGQALRRWDRQRGGGAVVLRIRAAGGARRMGGVATWARTG